MFHFQDDVGEQRTSGLGGDLDLLSISIWSTGTEICQKKVTEAKNLRKRVTCIIRYFATQTQAIVLHSITFFAQN